MRILKKILIWLAIIIVALVVIVFVASSFILNSFKPKLEEILTENTGFETRIDGKLVLKMMPGMSVIATDVKVISHETYLLSVGEIEASIDYTKLINKEIKVDKIYLTEPRVFIVQNASGIFNFEKLYALATPPVAIDTKLPVELNLEELTIHGGHFLYFNLSQHDTVEVSGIQFNAENISVQAKVNSFSMKGVKFNGPLSIDHFQMNGLIMDSVKLMAEANEGVLKLRELRRVFLGGKVSGQAIVDFTNKPTEIELIHEVTNMSATEFLRLIDSDEYLAGSINYSLHLNFKSFDLSEARKSAAGSILITGNDLTYYGLDLDQKLEQYKVTEQFDIWEVGAIFLAGPYGSAFVNGIDYSSLLQNYQGEETEVIQLNADWKINNGFANALDVAFSTEKYRLSATGNLDLTQNEFSNFKFAMLDKNGCAVLSQTLNGSFEDPISTSFAIKGIKLRSIEDIQKLMMKPSNRRCTPVYSGIVSHPGN